MTEPNTKTEVYIVQAMQGYGENSEVRPSDVYRSLDEAMTTHRAHGNWTRHLTSDDIWLCGDTRILRVTL